MLASSVARSTALYALSSVFRAGEVGHRLGEFGKVGGETVTADACIVEGGLGRVRVFEDDCQVGEKGLQDHTRLQQWWRTCLCPGGRAAGRRHVE
jgi:hypothetical protein